MKKMKKCNNIFVTMSLSILLVMFACEDLDELNINPNSPAPETTDLNLLLPTMLTDLGGRITDMGIGDIAGVMQHTQKTGWSSGHNNYDWNNPGQSWSGFYGILRNSDEFYNKAVDEGYEYHQAIGLIIKAYTFGLITDLWGDAPYSESLKVDDGILKPVFDSQQDIYHGIVADLKTANTLLSASGGQPINAKQDVLYGGDILKWRKLANSLALRYYMRLQAKEPTFAEDGITEIASDPGTYPIITSTSDDANIGYPGTAENTAWPITTEYFPNDPSNDYLRRKPCATLVDTMQYYNDPRMAVWFERVEIPLELVAGTNIGGNSGTNAYDPEDEDDGIRQVSQDVVDAYLANFPDEPNLRLDFDQDYVGIPAQTQAGQSYNLTADFATQGAYNYHVSQLSTMYSESSGDLLQMRLMSAAEVHFILAEAAARGWGVPGTAAGHYQSGVQESLNAWGIGNSYGTYIANAPYVDIGSIIFQKWIASWTAAAESWFDYRRTGMPDLQTGFSARRQAIPLRFYYSLNEDISTNPDNAEAAIEKLEMTSFASPDPKNSAWSKPWLLQGTGFPY